MTAMPTGFDTSTSPPPAGPTDEDRKPIVFFDGVCGFCNAWVDAIIRRDPHARLRFAPLQGTTAEQRLPDGDRAAMGSLVVWTPDGCLRKTAASVRIAHELGGIWSVAGTLLWLIPRPLRDAGYDLIARNRYRIAGKKETCRIPTPAERERFLP